MIAVPDWRISSLAAGHLPGAATRCRRLRSWAELGKLDCEGYVAKDENRVYEGGPTRRWLKVKQKGWTDAEGRWRRSMFASGADASLP